MDAPVTKKPKTEIVYSGRKRTTSLPTKPDDFSQKLEACKNTMDVSSDIIAQLEANIAERERVQQKNNETKKVVEKLASAIAALREDVSSLQESASSVAERDAQLRKEIKSIVSQQQTQTTLYAGASDRLTKINTEYLELIPHVKNLDAQTKQLIDLCTQLEAQTKSLEEEKSKVTQLQQDYIVQQSRMKFFGTISIMSLLGLVAAFWIWIDTHKAELLR